MDIRFPRIFIRVLPAEMPKYHTMCCSLSVRSCAALCKSATACANTSRAIRHLQNISALSDILFAAMTIWVMDLRFRRPVRWAFLAITTAGASLIDDVAKLTDKMKKRWPNLPYFLLGHSMARWLRGCI